MFKSCTFLVAFCSIISLARAQSPVFIIKKDTAIFTLERVSGIGPAGISSIGPADKSAHPADDPERKLFRLKNIPANLSDVKEYNMPVDMYQFTFQNYLEGVFTKQYFIDRANAQAYQWPLSDTLKLSRKPIKTSISFIAGVDSGKNPVFVLDANNNGNLADDLIKPLIWLRTGEQITGAAIGVKINYMDAGKIAEREMLVSISKSPNPNRFDISVFFPEYLYNRISFRGHNYFLCTSGTSLQPFMAVLDDKPSFIDVDRSKRISKGGYFKIGDADFKLVSINEYTRQVVITGKDIAELAADAGTHTKAVKHLQSGKKIVSTSLGYYAPLAKGVNINAGLSKGMQISTTNLKGKYIYLDFWGTYCIPCIEEIPNIKEAYTKFGRDKFEVIGILDERDMGVAKDLFKKHQLPWPNISLNATTTNVTGYGVIGSFPTSYLIGPDGKIAAVNLRGPELVSKLNELMSK
jgi:thiol-disulfide isomerase/thioredoxin